MLVDGLASDYGWPLTYILDELPLCQALACWRAILKRNDPEDGTPGFEDDEMVDSQDSAMRAEIAGYRRQARKKKGR
jgi:hypothetical protein